VRSKTELNRMELAHCKMGLEQSRKELVQSTMEQGRSRSPWVRVSDRCGWCRWSWSGQVRGRQSEVLGRCRLEQERCKMELGHCTTWLVRCKKEQGHCKT